MVGTNGIPRAPSPGRLEQRVRDLERTLERLTSARTYVSVGNIVEGGTIGQAAGAQLTETVQQLIIVEGGNLAPDALNNKALVGSSVTAEGGYMAGDAANPGNSYNPYRKVKTRAALDSRPDPYNPGAGGTGLPGLYLESEDPVTGKPFQPARLVDAGPGGTELRGAQAVKDGPSSRVAVGYTGLLRADGEPHPVNKLPGTYSRVEVGPTSFALQSTGQPDIVGSKSAAVSHNGDGVLRLEGANGVLVNGVPVGSGGMRIPSTLASLSGGFLHFAQSGWSGVRYSRSGDVAQVSGAYDRASYGSQEVVGILPKELWPPAKVKGTNVEINTAGQILTVTAGSGPQSLGITYLV